ncbi:MAG: thioredoxin [Acidimicrobiales bacterium]
MPHFRGSRAIVATNITALTDQTFDEEVSAATEPLLVDFWAEWCGPCKLIAPILQEIATEQAGKLRVAKVDVDENLEVARRFEVMSIPTLILFKDGVPKLRMVGAKGKGQLLQELQAFL